MVAFALAWARAEVRTTFSRSGIGQRCGYNLTGSIMGSARNVWDSNSRGSKKWDCERASLVIDDRTRRHRNKMDTFRCSGLKAIWCCAPQ